MARASKSRSSLTFGFTAGATLSLGLLSLAGFYALTPVMGVVITAFGLSMLYEAEIYHANIKSGLGKLLDNDFFYLLEANKLLEEILSTNISCAFLDDYKVHLDYLHRLEHLKKRSKAQQLALKKAEAKKEAMLRFFMKTLFSDEASLTTDYSQALLTNINTFLSSRNETPKSLKARIEQKQRVIKRFVFPSALVVGGLFGLGSLFLMCDALGVLSFISLSAAAMPYLVIPLAIAAGLGYIFLTFNSLSDMVWNDSVRQWVKELKHECKEGKKAYAITLVLASLILVAITLSLTLFTAGTWWTLAKNKQGVIPFMLKIPKAITAYIVPIFTGLSQLIFSLENIKETMDNFKGAIKSAFSELSWLKFNNFIKSIPIALVIAPVRFIFRGVAKAWKTENIVQFFNPFRPILKIIEAPIRLVGFIGHVVSIGATADEVPGVPSILCMIIAALSESFEDMHYFFDLGHHSHNHNHESNHNEHSHEHIDEIQSSDEEHQHACDHSHDIPTKFYQLLFSFIRIPQTLFHLGASKLNRFHCFNPDGTRPIFKNYQEASDNLTGLDKISTEETPVEPSSASWSKANTLMMLKEKQEVLPKGGAKHQAFNQLINEISQCEESRLSRESFKRMLNTQNNGVTTASTLSKHRHRLHTPGSKTDSEQLMLDITSMLNQSVMG